jgi:hypothetical protein
MRNTRLAVPTTSHNPVWRVHRAGSSFPYKPLSETFFIDNSNFLPQDEAKMRHTEGDPIPGNITHEDPSENTGAFNRRRQPSIPLHRTDY